MSEDRFFQQVNRVMSNYSPEVPQAVYSGMRKKLWWSNFTRLSFTRLNMWYLLLAVVSVSAWMSLSPSSTDKRLLQSEMEQEMVNATHESVTEVIAPTPAIETTMAQSTQEQEKKGEPASKQEKTTSADVTVAPSNDMTPPVVANVAESDSPVTAETPAAADNIQSVEVAKQGSKKGLKVKTYEQKEKK